MGALAKKESGRFIIIIFIMVLMVSIVTSSTLEAYDVRASHKVNQKLNMEEEKKKIWDSLRTMGFSEQATAGIMGNFMRESSCNRTVTQGHVPWSSFRFDYTGIGLAQWTSEGRQRALFKVADSQGKQWTELSVQMKHFEKEIKGYSFSSVGGLAGFKKLTDVDKATVVFENVYERAGIKAMSQRKQYARAIYKKFTGREVSTSLDEGTVNVTSSGAVISEWDLVGMEGKSGLLDKSYDVKLPSYDDLNIGEKYSVSLIKDDLLSDREMDVYNFLRVFAVFLGLCAILYSVFLIVGYIFDRTNNILEISMIRIVTFGRLGYTDDDECENTRGYVGRNRIIKVALVCMVVGFVVISGVVFNWIESVVYWLIDKEFL